MTDDTLTSREYKLQTEGGSEVAYTLRGLSDAEVEPWTVFCASVFSYKDNPPSASYFMRHFAHDPQRDAALIRVAFCGNQMVASCRVFCRQVSLGNGESVSAGGIGEVCTDAAHRKRGLSSALLMDAIRIMERRGMKLSLLHAAPSFFSVYQKAGYTGTTTQWSVISVDRSNLRRIVLANTTPPNQTVRLLVADDVETLHKLHQGFSERRLAGCIVRSMDYWKQYLIRELEGSVYVLVYQVGVDMILGWMALQRKGDKLRIQEFGCVDHDGGRTIHTVFATLLNHALDQKRTATSVDDPSGELQTLLYLPTFVCEQLQASSLVKKDYIDYKTIPRDDDLGWMYRPIGPDGVSMSNLTVPHWIWPSDSF